MDLLFALLIPTALMLILVGLLMIAADVKKLAADVKKLAADVKKLLAMRRSEHTASQSQPPTQPPEAASHR